MGHKVWQAPDINLLWVAALRGILFETVFRPCKSWVSYNVLEALRYDVGLEDVDFTRVDRHLEIIRDRLHNIRLGEFVAITDCWVLIHGHFYLILTDV